jgi:hypothetical protein
MAIVPGWGKKIFAPSASPNAGTFPRQGQKKVRRRTAPQKRDSHDLTKYMKTDK